MVKKEFDIWCLLLACFVSMCFKALLRSLDLLVPVFLLCCMPLLSCHFVSLSLVILVGPCAVAYLVLYVTPTWSIWFSFTCSEAEPEVINCLQDTMHRTKNISKNDLYIQFNAINNESFLPT